MLRNPRSLKRNNWELVGILIGPSMAPRFTSKIMASAPDQISRRGWRTDA
jgi:hypothetical protein